MRLYWIAHAFEWISMFSFLTFLVYKNVVRSAHMVPAIVLVVFENWSYGSLDCFTECMKLTAKNSNKYREKQQQALAAVIANIKHINISNIHQES